MPKILPGYLIMFTFLLFFLALCPAYAKLGTNELGNTEKDKISQLAKNIAEQPEEGDIAFRDSSELIEINHIEAFKKLKELYEKGSDTIKAKIIKAIGLQRKYVIDAPDEYWQILSQALGSTKETLLTEVVRSLAWLESEAFFDKLLETLNAKEISKSVLDNIVEVLCTFNQGPSGERIIETKTIGLRVDAVRVLSEPEHKRRLLEALGKWLALDFAATDQLEQWWKNNKDKSIAQILDDKSRRGDAKLEEFDKLAEQRRLQFVAERIEKYKLLLAVDEKKAVVEFLKELKDPKAEPEVLAFVIRELGRLNIKDAVQPLLARLKLKDIHVRIAAIEALGEIDDKSVIEEIRKKCSAEQPQERLAAINTIAKLGTDVSAKILLEALESEKDRIVQSAIIQGLGHVGDPSAIPDLVNLVANKQEKGLKLRDTVNNDLLKEVATALGRVLTSGKKIEKLDRQLAVKSLLLMLSVNNNPVVYAAIDNLGNAGAQEATTKLTDILKGKADSGIRAAAARALGRMPNPEPAVIEELFQHLKDKAAEVAQDCLRSLRNIAGLNGSANEVKLNLLLELSSKLKKDKETQLIRELLKNLPDDKGIGVLSEEKKEHIYSIMEILAWAHNKSGDYKGAAELLEKILDYVKDAKRTVQNLEMLADVCEAQGQLSKAMDVYDRIIKMVDPAQSEPYWAKKVTLIEKIADPHEALKRAIAALGQGPPAHIKEKLEKLKKDLSAKLPKEPKTP